VGFKDRVEKALDEFDAGLADDLNTAVALASAFDLLREANISMDAGSFGQEDAIAARKFLAVFDQVFSVIIDDDAEKLKELGYGPAGGPSETEIEALIAERQSARQRRDFAKSDEIRQKLGDRGIILEDIKDGTVRWKRK